MKGPGGARPSAGPALAVVALGLALRAFDPAPVERLRLAAFDAFQRASPRAADAALRPAIVVDIDESSLAAHGPWPWPRATIAALVDAIAASRPAAVGLDLLLVEPDRFGGDERLGESLRRVPSVLAVAPVRTVDGTPRPPAAAPPVRVRGVDRRGAFPAYDAAVTSLGAIDAGAAGRGAIVTIPERDGVVRRLPSAVRVGDVVVPSFALEMVRVAAGAPALTVDGGAAGVSGVEAGGFRAPTGSDGRMWLHASAHAPWRFVSAADVLAGRAELPASRLILVGSTAVGLGDVVATPVEPAMAGVEIHAQAIESILTGTLLRRPSWATPVELLLAAAAGLGVVASVRRLPARRAAWALALVAPIPLASWGAFERGLLVDATWPIVVALAAFPAALAASLAVEQRERRRVEAEMDAAREIQMSMLPALDAIAGSGRGVEIDAALVPARYVGGDLYDALWLDERRLFFLVGDVSGKGAPAALFMALVKTLCRTLASRVDGGVARVLVEADRELATQNPSMMFVTLAAGVLDAPSGTLELVLAGHDAPLRLRPGEAPRTLDAASGPPLGAVAGYPYETTRTTLDRGDTLLIVTDGVTDARGTGEERYGMRRVKELLARGSDMAPVAVVRALLDDVNRFAAGTEPADDVTVLALRRT